MGTRGRQVALAVAPAIAAALIITQLPTLGAAALLHPFRSRARVAAPDNCRDALFDGAGVTLAGWRCRAPGYRRGTVIYLHGVADNRSSAVGVVPRFTARGFDVIAYDSRAHGDSGGDACTYGFYEKEDLRLVIDTLDGGPVVLMGTSLGAAVALQHAPRDRRVRAVVAAETFSDLRTVVTERAPLVFTPRMLSRAFALAEQLAGFEADAVSPVRAALEIVVPVLLIHGAADRDTLPAHSQRVFEALGGPKQLRLVPGAGHSASIRDEVWVEIDAWVEDAVKAAAITRRRAARAATNAPYEPP